MDRLPNEVCEMIAAETERVGTNIELKGLSLLNRQWAAVSRRYLFQNAHVIFWKPRFECFKEIVNHPIYSRCVQRLHFHVPWLPRSARNGPLSEDSPWPYEAPRSLEEGLRKEHARYKADFWVAVTGDKWKSTLARLVNLETIEIDAGDVWSLNYSPCWKAFQEAQSEPWSKLSSARLNQLVAQLQLPETSRLHEISLTHLYWNSVAWAPTEDKRANWIALLAKAKHLHITMDGPDPYTQAVSRTGYACSRAVWTARRIVGLGENAWGAAFFLAMAPKEKLELSLRWNSYGDQHKYLSLTSLLPIRDRPTVAVGVRRLALTGLRMNWTVLREVLSGAKDTLEYLELGDLKIFMTWGSEDFKEEPSNWPVHFFTSLVQSYRLRGASFSGHLRISPDVVLKFDKPIQLLFVRHQCADSHTIGYQLACAVSVQNPLYYSVEPPCDWGVIGPSLKQRISWVEENVCRGLEALKEGPPSDVS